MIIEMGFIVFVGLTFLFIKLPKRIVLRLLAKPLWLDLGISVLAYILHFGTFSGMMAAAVAGLMTSIFTTLARRAWGYIDKDRYVPGWFAVDLGDFQHAGVKDRK